MPDSDWDYNPVYYIFPFDYLVAAGDYTLSDLNKVIALNRGHHVRYA